MNAEIKRLPDAELEIMQEIWRADGPVTSSELQERLLERHTWKLPTTLGFLTRLMERGFISCEKRGRINVYTALVEEKTYLESETRSFLERLCGNSLKTFVSSLYNGKAIGQRELEELQGFIDDAVKGERE